MNKYIVYEGYLRQVKWNTPNSRRFLLGGLGNTISNYCYIYNYITVYVYVTCARSSFLKNLFG